MLLSSIYVDASAPGTVQNGTSWTNAYRDLQAALGKAQGSDRILVANGIYKPTATTDRTISFNLKSGVALYGGYAGYGATNPDARNVAIYPSILSGDIGIAGNGSDNSYHVLYSSGTSATAVLDGFTITAGNATGSQVPYGYGGGMYNSSSSPTLSNCIFAGNSAGDGGGMYNSLSSPTLSNCVFSGNSAVWDSGGGIYNISSSPKLTNCTFSQDSAKSSGGGIYNGYACSPVLTNCILWGCSACDNAQIYQFGDPLAITYSDIQGGWAGMGNISVDPLFVRSPSPGPDGTWSTVDDDYGDLRVKPYSPVVDAGDSSAVPSGITTDLAGNSRLSDVPTTPDVGAGNAPLVDMGAYEVVPALAASAGGPYFLLQGESIPLSGTGASNMPGALQYAWEWSGDGKYDEATGPNPVFSGASRSSSSPVTVSLRVTDGASRSVVSTTTVVVMGPVLYVDTKASGNKTGSSWSNAFTSLAEALSRAVPGQEIRVADGIYKPTASSDRTISFNLKGGVAIYGGYAGYGAPNPDSRDVALYPSVLSGDIGVAGNNADNSYHVLYSSGVDATAVIDGFTITGGSAYGSGTYHYGGGMYNDSSSPRVSNCTFTGNRANYGGGGMYNTNASPTLTNCIFSGNSADGIFGYGGGMYNKAASPKLVNCVFNGNSTSYSGGAMYNDAASPTLINCTFDGNSVVNPTYYEYSGGEFGGGGMHNAHSSSPILTDCTFSGNSALVEGGGMCNSSSSPSLTNCIFSRNSAYGKGGGMYNSSSSPTLTNCTFSGNWVRWDEGAGGGIYNASSSPILSNCILIGNATLGAYGSGGGLYNETSSPMLNNCTFSGNLASSRGGGMLNSSSSPAVANCILWGNTAPSGAQMYNYSASSPVATYSDIQGGWSGTGNINADPLFLRSPSAGLDAKWGTADDDYGDLRLRLTSPAIDAGDNAAVPSGSTTDLAGNDRFWDIPAISDTGSGTAPIVDMGAYEASNLAVARPGGPYTVSEGLTVRLSGTGTPAPGFSITAYEWDFNYDGVSFNVDATGTSPTFSAAGLDGPSTRTLAMRVRDNAGQLSDPATTTVTITNAAPALSLSCITSSPKVYTYFVLNLTYFDPGPDTVTRWAVNWGDGYTQPFDQNPSPAGHLYTVIGDYTVTATVTDEDGTWPASNSISVHVLPNPASIRGKLFSDLNSNGSQDAGEPALSGWTVYLDANRNGALDPAETKVTSDVTGAYAFPSLTPTMYTVRCVLPTGWYATQPLAGSYTISAGPGMALTGKDFALHQNQLPISRPGSSYTVREGSSITLSGAASSDSDGSIAAYEWDFNYDGAKFDVDAAGVSPTFSATGLAAPATRTIALRVQDDRGQLSDPVTTTVTIRLANPASFRGTLFNDMDADGQHDSTEPALRGWQLYIDTNRDGRPTRGEPTTYTDASGLYSFTELPSGSYSLRTLPPANWRQTAPTSSGRGLNLSPGQSLSGQDFAFTQSVQITGTLFNDADGDGVQDSGEGALRYCTVWLDMDRDGVMDSSEPSAISNRRGGYTFAAAPAGSYRLRPAIPRRWRQSGSSFYDLRTAPGSIVSRKVFSLTQKILICGTVFSDGNGDGQISRREGGLGGWTVFVDANRNGLLDSGEKSVLSDAGGNWSFSDLDAGSYLVRVLRPRRYALTTPASGAFSFSLASGQSASGNLFGIRRIA